MNLNDSFFVLSESQNTLYLTNKATVNRSKHSVVTGGLMLTAVKASCGCEGCYFYETNYDTNGWGIKTTTCEVIDGGTCTASGRIDNRSIIWVADNDIKEDKSPSTYFVETSPLFGSW